MLVVQCERCGATNPEGSAFCGTCGLRQGAVDGLSAIRPFDRSDATRYMSVAMHVDRTLAGQVIDEIEDDHHARVSNEGVDLAEVGRHAFVARRRQAVRDGALVLDVVAMLVFLALRQVWGFLVLFVGLWAINVAYEYVARYGRLSRSLARTPDAPARAPDPQSPRLRERVEEYGARPYSNVTVYSGFYPFVGLGPVINGWSLAVDIGKPKEGVAEVDPVTVDDMRQAIVDAIRQLAWSEVRIDDHVFIRGTDIRDDTRFLPDPLGRPVDRIADDLVRQFMVDPHLKARHYLRIRYHSWGEELVVTRFVRLAAQGTSLFIETALSVLMPVREDYHRIDDLVFPPTIKQLLGLAWQAARSLPRALISAPAGALRWMMASYLRHRKNRREERAIREHRGFDYGAAITPRERAAQSYHYYFQILDRDMFSKVLNKRLVDTIIGFLDSRGVDTTDLRDRTNTILNNGIFVTGGGSFSGGNVAAGDHAAVNTGAPSQSQPKQS
jgi:hypothetical protein